MVRQKRVRASNSLSVNCFQYKTHRGRPFGRPFLLPPSLLDQQRYQTDMGKYFLFALIAMLIGGGIWFYRLGGPAQLDLADRLWFGKAEFSGRVRTASNYGDTDNPRQSYDVYFPPAYGKETPDENCLGPKYPSLIFFHGGSWRDGNRVDYGFVGRAFAARGFITYVADYRKAPSNPFPDFVQDTAALIATVHRSLPENGCQDPKQIYVMGHSAGAHIAMMAALDPQWLAAHGTDPSIISGVIGLAGPYDFLPFTTDAARDALGQWPNPQETQPIHYARGDAPPMLLLSGEDDTTVRPRNSKILAQAITAKGGKAEVKIYPKVDHAGIVMAISRAFRKKAPVIKDVVAFTKAVKPETDTLPQS